LWWGDLRDAGLAVDVVAINGEAASVGSRSGIVDARLIEANHDDSDATSKQAALATTESLAP
tara:strand:+ start:31569 stop:31754 length:186 start_codon:yes stop_codon:yes gene_type:complete